MQKAEALRFRFVSHFAIHVLCEKWRRSGFEFPYFISSKRLSKRQAIMADNSTFTNFFTTLTAKTDCNSSISSTVDPYELLRKQGLGNALYILFGILGCFGNGLIFRVFYKYSEFHFKSYIPLVSLAVADFIACFGFILVGSVRLTELIGPFYPSMLPKTCLLIQLPAYIGITASITNDLMIAIDRFLFMLSPFYHRHRLGVKYLAFLCLISWSRAIVETSLFFQVRNKQVCAYATRKTTARM